MQDLLKCKTDTHNAMMLEPPLNYEIDGDILFAAPPRIAAVDGKVKIVDCGICNMWCSKCERSTVHESSPNGFVCTEC